MSRPTAIELRGVGKRFTKYVDTPMLLTSALRFRPQTRRDKFWALARRRPDRGRRRIRRRHREKRVRQVDPDVADRRYHGSD